MALFPGGCEFPLLRERFWRLAAAGMADARRSPSPNKAAHGVDASQVQQQLAVTESSPLPELPTFGDGSGSASRPRLRQTASMSVDLGAALRRRRDGGEDASPSELQRCESAAEAGPRGRLMGLRSLDLQALPRDDAGPVSELGVRRQKFALFENHCSEVAPGLCVGGGAVAGNHDVLAAAGVTHVVNCVGMLVPNAFPNELDYLTLYLNDVPGEDLTSVLYTVFDYIEAARSGGGCVLVHCSQGVSRSAALVIGYLMWKLAQPYDEVYQAVKAIRGVANPNIGFTCQLLQWQKRRASPRAPACLLRLAPAAADTPDLLVPKAVPAASEGALDPRGAFVLATPQRTYIWQGSRCTSRMAEAADAAADQLARYEGAPAPPQHSPQGAEPPEFAEALGAQPGFAAAPVDAYDADYEIAAKAADVATPAERQASAPRPALGLRLGDPTADEGATPRGSKTPRAADGGGGSPNTRRRKSARAALAKPVSPGRPSQDSLEPSSSSEDESDDDGSSDGSASSHEADWQHA